MESLEDSFRHPERVDPTQLTIEHIMPETLTQDWKRYLGENWEDVYYTYVHTIGNLTLVGGPPNSQIRNKLFLEKKDQWYNLSNVELTKQIAEKWSAWRAAEITERAEGLAQIALRIWAR